MYNLVTELLVIILGISKRLGFGISLLLFFMFNLNLCRVAFKYSHKKKKMKPAIRKQDFLQIWNKFSVSHRQVNNRLIYYTQINVYTLLIYFVCWFFFFGLNVNAYIKMVLTNAFIYMMTSK